MNEIMRILLFTIGLILLVQGFDQIRVRINGEEKSKKDDEDWSKFNE